MSDSGKTEDESTSQEEETDDTPSLAEGQELIPRLYSTPLKRNTHFIGIHLGAGNHLPKMFDRYKALCKSACEAGLRILRKGGGSDEAVIAATVVLENSGLANTGKGSNLTWDKTVECDAGFMNGQGYFGGVGAVEGVPNPILIAHKIAVFQDSDNQLSCGRVPPMFLVGSGARKWAESQRIPTCEASLLVSKKALKRHAKYMKKIELAETAKNAEATSDAGVSDTVGVIALDHKHQVAATVSSGGNWLKTPGRVGHSPQFGAGCWAMNCGPMSDIAVAVSTTGVGEMLSKIQWASQCAKLLQDKEFDTPVQAITSGIKEKFLESDLLCHHTEPRIAGMIGLTWDGHSGEFVWGHSSHSLVVAAGGTSFKRVKTILSTLSKSKSEADECDGIKVEAMVI